MANRLKMAKVNAIVQLRERGWPFRRIARELGVHRDTVSRVVREATAGADPAKAPLGSEGAVVPGCAPTIMARWPRGIKGNGLWTP
ncbi:MAG: helix-turn-helix domain-containing protein [Candidatus Brocadiae bacterium]|nr:helix-turn-helix domain-containing protein [Candidatus Brocadiia bacterium]